MVLKKVTGTKIVVDFQVDVRSDDPMLLVYAPGRAFIKTLALRLLGVTALDTPAQMEAVQQAAAALDDDDDYDWVASDAQTILSAVGSLPTPTHVRVHRLAKQGILLFQAVGADTPKARELTYPPGSARPSISLLAALRAEGTKVPEGMCMEVPVKLVEDGDGLALAAYFRRGRLRDASEEQSGQSAQSEQGSASK